MSSAPFLLLLLTISAYHISLLIQVSKIAKDQTDHALSADLLERALFSFGRAATSLFNTKLSQGKARLDFARPENRELWLAGYQYIKSLVMKGTYRTALEWAKLLLSLDPEGDPYCMRLMIHQLSLRAREFNWLLDVSESEMPSIWAPSYLGKCHAASHTTPSLAFAALQLREGKKCREILTDSMQKLPWLFTHLFKELSLDAPPSIWGMMPRTEAETLFTEMYVLQTKDLWNTPEATALLMEIAHTISKPNLSAIPNLENEEMTLDVVRFVYLDNTPALMALAPSKLLHRSNNSDADPLPPDANVYSYDSQRLTIEGRDHNHETGPFNNYNPFDAIRQLLPNWRRGSDDEDIDVGDNAMGDAMRRELEFAMAHDERFAHEHDHEHGHEHDEDYEDVDEDEDEDDEEGLPPVGVTRRLMNMLRSMGMPGTGYDDDAGDSNTDTDEEMPDLVEPDTDDAMPELVPLNE